jgi:hypothetical protein
MGTGQCHKKHLATDVKTGRRHRCKAQALVDDSVNIENCGRSTIPVPKFISCNSANRLKRRCQLNFLYLIQVLVLCQLLILGLPLSKALIWVLSQKQIQGMEIPLPYLYLSGDTKDLVDERDLSCHIIPSDILDLSFADHRHRFIAFEGTSSRIEGTEA